MEFVRPLIAVKLVQVEKQLRGPITFDLWLHNLVSSSLSARSRSHHTVETYHASRLRKDVCS